MKNCRSYIVAAALFSAGCSTSDGLTGFSKWKHPSTGKDNLLADRTECERSAKQNRPYMAVNNQSERAGRDLGRMFADWDYTKECLMKKGYIKDE